MLTVAPPGGAPFTLKGTADPHEGGRFVSSVKVVVLAGGGGWATPVPAQHFQNANGISSLTVEQDTAALVGEKVNDPVPISLGTDWVREGSEDEPRPASTVFGDRQWYVDTQGTTQVQSWPAVTPDSSLELLEWDPLQQCGLVACDTLVLPGTVITDSRFDGPITVRDVDQTFDRQGSRARIWCSSEAVTRLMSALSQMVRTFGKLGGLKRWTYRIVTQDGSTLNLQAVLNADGTKPPIPDCTKVNVWPGMAGLSAKHTLASNVGVVFRNGDFSQPTVVDFDGTLPQELTIDAANVLHLGAGATTTKLGESASDYQGAGAAYNGATCTVMLPPECPVVGIVSGLPFVGVVTFAYPAPGVINSGRVGVLV